MPRSLPIRSRAAVAAALIALSSTASADPPSAGEESLAGAYLAARAAITANDYAVAMPYLDLVLEHEPEDRALLESALTARLALGEFDDAVTLARRIEELGVQSQTASLALIVGMLEAGDYEQALEALEERGIGPLVDGLLRGWAQLAAGRMSQTLQEFDELAEQRGTEAFGLYHKALALAHVGDFEGAEAILSGEAGGPLGLTRRGVIARVQILGQLGEYAQALELLEQVFGADDSPEIAQLRTMLEADEAPGFDTVTTPQDGMAEAFLDLAVTLRGETDDTFTLIFARAAEFLRPDQVEALLQVGELLTALGQYELATDVYSGIGEDDLLYHHGQIGRADALFRLGEVENARALLEALVEVRPAIPEVHTALGDLLRRESLFDAASAAYDDAIALLGEPQRRHWSLYYTRAITHEREGRWEEAQADFRKALELNPDQPSVLNYLGYSLVERRENLDEALDMIERAVAAEPESGYITDSLGWALYRLGRYEEAVEPMERAVELLPRDPIINDHLGDVYWMVGRRLEARFQWQRALSFGPADDLDMDRIRRKLDVGLDRVLEEEGEADAPPAAGHDG